MAELYDAYSRIVFGLILQMVRDRGAAEDLTQEAFLRVWNHIALFDETRGMLDTWLVCVARNRAIDYLRVKGRRVERQAVCLDDAPEPRSASAADEGSEQHDQRRVLAPALERLSPRQRLLLDMNFVDGLSHGEIARKVRQPLGTVKTLIRRAIKAMRLQLETSGTV